MDRKFGRDNFYRMIIQEGGLDSLVRIARMSPNDGTDLGYRIKEIGKTVFISPIVVAARF